MYAGNGLVVDAYDDKHGVILESLSVGTADRRDPAHRRPQHATGKPANMSNRALSPTADRDLALIGLRSPP